MFMIAPLFIIRPTTIRAACLQQSVQRSRRVENVSRLLIGFSLREEPLCVVPLQDDLRLPGCQPPIGELRDRQAGPAARTSSVPYVTSFPESLRDCTARACLSPCVATESLPSQDGFHIGKATYSGCLCGDGEKTPHGSHIPRYMCWHGHW